MDFAKAADAHLKWRDRIVSHLATKDITLDVETIARNDVCELGRWLESIKLHYKTNFDFIELLRLHTAFHKEVASIVERRNNDEELDLQIILGHSSPFSVLSKKIVLLLIKLKDEIPL